jgi:hypothetical protein
MFEPVIRAVPRGLRQARTGGGVPRCWNTDVASQGKWNVGLTTSVDYIRNVLPNKPGGAVLGVDTEELPSSERCRDSLILAQHR